MAAPQPKGLRTLVFTVADLAAAKDWYAEFLGYAPYFDEPFYVGFDLAGYELGFLPAEVAEVGAANTTGGTGIAYWAFADIDAAWARLIEMGATAHAPIVEVGGGIRVGAVADPFGNLFGLIDNPTFKAAD